MPLELIPSRGRVIRQGITRDPAGRLWVTPETAGQAFHAREVAVRPWNVKSGDTILAPSHNYGDDTVVRAYPVLSVERAPRYFSATASWRITYARSYSESTGQPVTDSITVYADERATVFRPVKPRQGQDA